MIQLDRHIEILLLDNDCVIVPGLGGFMAHHICAHYSEETGTYLPPMRQLGFNSQLQINDSLLAQSYIEAYDISYPEAIKRIDSEVAELKQMLQNEGECELNDIGKLKLNIEGNLEFLPCDAGILTPELYGLNYIDILPISHNETETQTISEPLTLNDKLKPVPHLSIKATNGSNSETTESEFKHTNTKAEQNVEEEADEEPCITIRISTLKHIATVAAIIIALFVCAIPFGKLNQPELSESYMDTGILYNILPSDTQNGDYRHSKSIIFKKSEQVVNEQNTDSASEEIITDKVNATVEESGNNACEKQTDNKNNSETTHKTQTDEHFFSIVLASRVTVANGNDYVKRLKKGGFDKAMVIERNNGAKVIYGKFSSKQEAQEFLNNLRTSAQDFADGWIMEF